MKIVRKVIFPDHHLYTTSNFSSIKEKSKGVDCIVTTEKDMVKLKRFNMTHVPIRALRIEMKIWEEKKFYQEIMKIF